MPYKRKQSPFYYVHIRSLPGYGDSTPISTRTKNKRTAEAMDAALRDLAERAILTPAYTELLDAICKDKSVSLALLLKAKNTDSIDALLRTLSDPLVHDLIKKHSDIQHVDYLYESIPENMRLSELTGKRITELCIERERMGYKRNTVVRWFKERLSLLIRKELGNAQRDAIFSDVHYSRKNDTREVHLSPSQIADLVAAAASVHDELPALIWLALTTSADKGVLLCGNRGGKYRDGLLVKDVTIWVEKGRYEGTIFLKDGKAKDRRRTVRLSESRCRDLHVLCDGKAPDDWVFSFNYGRLERLWQLTKQRAGLPGVRFKDLRAQTAIYAEEANVPQTVIQRTMGHSDDTMTKRYQARQAQATQEQIEAIEAAMRDRAQLKKAQ